MSNDYQHRITKLKRRTYAPIVPSLRIVGLRSKSGIVGSDGLVEATEALECRASICIDYVLLVVLHCKSRRGMVMSKGTRARMACLPCSRIAVQPSYASSKRSSAKAAFALARAAAYKRASFRIQGVLYRVL